MSTMLADEKLNLIYPSARMLGRRITRLPESSLGRIVFDASIAKELGRNHIGLFVGNHPGMERVIGQLANLDSNPEGGIWVVVPLGRERSCELHNRWPFFAHVEKAPSLSDSFWRSRKICVAIPEDLEKIRSRVQSFEPGIAGIIIIDPPCILHGSKAGCDVWGRYHRNDRPQHVVSFRASLDFDGWQPPIILITERAAKSVNTESVARSFCLNAFWFINGDTFGCWDESIDLDCLMY